MGPGGHVQLLDADPDLASGLSPSETEAVRRMTVPAYRLRRGPLPAFPAPPRGSHVGLLVVRGLLLREVAVLGRPAAELLGPGDLIRPWPAESIELLPRTISWTVLEKAVVVDVSTAVVARLSAVPQVVETLLERGLTRTHGLTLDRAIASQVRVDVRVLACLWRLAERWGIMTAEGVRLSLPLTHAVLARMVAARRPTVTTALQRLTQLGFVRREDGAFILSGDAQSIVELDRRSPSQELAYPADGNGASAHGNGASADGNGTLADTVAPAA
jgi:CRP-like cAMP-binding protein